MRPTLAAFVAIAGLTGAAAVVLGLIRSPTRTGDSRTVRRWFGRRGARASVRPSVRYRIGAATAVGAVLWLLTGWVLAVVVVPAAILGLPVLLQTSTAKTEIARLEAMSEWAQNLSGVLGVGVGIEQAITASLRSAPPPIRTEVSRLVARLQARWDTATALRAFADDLDDATGDFLAAALVLGAHRRGSQLSNVLDGMAAAVRDDVRMRRTVNAEQAKGRTTVRIVTGFSAAGVGLMLVSPFAEPYRTVSGQVVLAGLLAGYAGCLIWMRRITATPRQPRVLIDGA